MANGKLKLNGCHGFRNDLQDHCKHVQLTIFQQPYQTLILAPVSVSNVSALSKFARQWVQHRAGTHNPNLQNCSSLFRIFHR